MKTMIKSLIVASVLGLAIFHTPTTANADHAPYWRNHWGWYDNTYRPYYYNYYGPSYGGGYYYSRPYYGGYYNNGYYGGYYGPNYYGPGVGVRVGRLNFGWW